MHTCPYKQSSAMKSNLRKLEVALSLCILNLDRKNAFERPCRMQFLSHSQSPPEQKPLVRSGEHSPTISPACHCGSREHNTQHNTITYFLKSFQDREVRATDKLLKTAEQISIPNNSGKTKWSTILLPRVWQRQRPFNAPLLSVCRRH